jgi:DNA-binding MarR family transcriptional regulator
MNKITKFKMCGYFDTTPAAKLLYIVLDELTGDGGEIVVSQRRISDALQLSRSAVSRNLHRLEHAGAISIMPTYHSDGGRAANKYYVL